MERKDDICREEYLGMLRELRNARYKALADSEEYISIVHCVEQLGSLLMRDKTRKFCTLGHSENCLYNFVKCHYPEYEKWKILYRLVKDGRNDLVHEGAAARQLTKWLVEMCIVLEDALIIAANSGERSMMAEDLMIREVVVAESWEELATVRHKMLERSISYLPTFYDSDKSWYLIEDSDVARYLKAPRSSSHRRQKVKEFLGKLTPKKARKVSCSEKIEEIFDDIMKQPVLVVEKDRLLGILTAFDLLSTIDSIN